MKKVQKGDNLEVKASTWNNFIDAANYVKNVQSNQHANTIEGGLSNGIVWVKNSENGTFPQFSALVLSDILIKPDQNESEFKNRVPVFLGVKMDNDLVDKPYCILLEPIASQKIGRALISGVTAAEVYIQNVDDNFVVPTVGSNFGALESSSTGSTRILWRANELGNVWCLVQVSGSTSSSTSSSSYDGPFKVEIDSTTVDDEESYFVKVYNSLYPENQYCGMVRFGYGYYYVPCTDLPLETGYIYLKSEWDSESSILKNSIEFFANDSLAESSNTVEYTLLAEINAEFKKATQQYYSGNLNIYWRAY